MKKLIYPLVIVLTALFSFLITFLFIKKPNKTLDNITPKTQKPLEIYSIENLSKTNIVPGKIILKKVLSQNENYNSYLISFEFNPNPAAEYTKMTTGLINLPANSINPPILVLIRGYVNQKLYETGVGSKRVGEYFANKGFVTIALDFLGYAGSDKEADNIFESRFQTYTAVLSLLETLENYSSNQSLISGFDQFPKYQTTKIPIFLWGHSNGGQIALTVLEITGKTYPTSLWAPVSKPFPYSILFYTDNSDDGGKLIRLELSKFENLYDVNKYSINNYFSSIKAPIVLHQGTNDDAVPVSWSNSLYQNLDQNKIEVLYKLHNGSDHNMNPAWNDAVLFDYEYFMSQIDIDK